MFYVTYQNYFIIKVLSFEYIGLVDTLHPPIGSVNNKPQIPTVVHGGEGGGETTLL